MSYRSRKRKYVKNACTNCRAAHASCTNKKACKRCVKLNLECTVEPTAPTRRKRRKSELQAKATKTEKPTLKTIGIHTTKGAPTKPVMRNSSLSFTVAMPATFGRKHSAIEQNSLANELNHSREELQKLHAVYSSLQQEINEKRNEIMLLQNRVSGPLATDHLDLPMHPPMDVLNLRRVTAMDEMCLMSDMTSIPAYYGAEKTDPLSMSATSDEEENSIETSDEWKSFYSSNTPNIESLMLDSPILSMKNEQSFNLKTDMKSEHGAVGVSFSSMPTMPFVSETSFDNWLQPVASF